MKKIICIGSATKDIFLTLSEVKIIDNAEDITAQKLMAFEYGAKVYADGILEVVGGSAVNVAAGLTKAGHQAFVFSRTSKGELGKWILKAISKLKAKKNFMQQNGRVESEVTVVLLDKKSIEHVILRTGDSTELFNVKKALEKYDRKADWIYVGSQKKDWQAQLKAVLEFAENKKSMVAFNPSSYQISNDSKKLVDYFSKIDVLLINRDEALEIVKNIDAQVQDKPKALLERIKQLGPKVVIITDGARGAYGVNEHNFYHLPAKIIKKVDSLGAGDAFCSGFLSSFIENNDVKKAMACGMASSAGVISQIGGSAGLPGKKELEKQSSELISTISQLS